MPEKAPWPDSTPEEDAAYALEAQMWDMEFERDVVEQGGPQLAEYVDAEKARVLPVGEYTVQGVYRPPGEEKSIMEIERFAPIARKLRQQGIEAPAPDTAAAIGGANATPQIWAHEFGHRRVEHEGGGSNERWRLIHDAFRSDTPTEWADAVSRWWSWNRRRFSDDPEYKTYGDVERHLKEAIASNRNYLLDAEVEARESEGDVPQKREGFFTIESLRKDQEDQMERRAKNWSVEKYNEDVKRRGERKASGGKVTMPSKSPEQARLMHAVASGWTPSRMKNPPSRAVAQEFVDADRKYSGGFAENRYWVGGLAPMSKVNAGLKGSLDNPLREFEEGGYAEGGKYGTEPLSFEDIIRLGGRSGYGMAATWLEFAKLGWEQDPNTKLFYPPEQTVAGGEPGDTATYDPYYGASSGTGTGSVVGPKGGRRGGRRGGRGGRRDGGENGGGGGGPGGGDSTADPTCPSGRRGPRGNCIPVGAVPPGADVGEGRIIPTDPASYVGGTSGSSGEGSDYRKDLRKHQRKIENILSGSARGGHVNYYEEGGAVRPGHLEGANPYEGKGMPNAYAQWERKHHIDPPPPEEEVAGEEVPEPGFLERWFGIKPMEPSNVADIEEKMKALEEATGGYIGYQNGGLAIAAPAGGVPPWIEPVGSGPGYSEEPQGYQFGGAARGYRGVPPQRGGIRRGGGFGGGRQPRGMMSRGATGDPAAMAGRMRGMVGAQRGQLQPQAGMAGRAQEQLAAMRGAAGPGPGAGGPAPQGALAEMYGRAQQQQAGATPGGGGIAERMRQAQAQQTAAAGGLPPGIDPRAVAADPEGWARQQAEAQRLQLPGGGGGVMDRLGIGSGRFGEEMRRARGMQTYQDVVNRGGGGINPMQESGRRLYDPNPGGDPTYGGGKQLPGSRIAPPPGKYPQGDERGPMIPGGPRVPPNMRGYLQKQRMMNRPPANVGGAQQQRVGMQDQQGALARAMQKGAGRAPMSRRMGFGRGAQR